MAAVSSALDVPPLCGHSMGTTWTVRVVPGPNAAFQRESQREVLRQDLNAALDDLIAQMSHWEPDSLLSRFNRASTGWYQVPLAFFEVLCCAVQIARLTDGAYDPTVGELVQLWGFGANQRKPGEPLDAATLPEPDQIAAARQRSGWQKLHLNLEQRGVWQAGGVWLDFSAIAKGYGVDVMAQVLERHGVQHYMVELGGELRVRGQRQDGQAWQLQIEPPQIEAPDNENPALPIRLNNLSIATSGDYRRYFLYAGRRYAHTLDPRTGLALQNDLASVSVIHPQCMVADALSTALLCMGGQDGLAFASQHRIAALFMHRASKSSHDFAVQWTDDFYRLAQPEPHP